MTKEKRIEAVAAAVAAVAFLVTVTQARTAAEALANAVGAYFVFLLVRWGLRKAT
jgi:hypothetical protein